MKSRGSAAVADFDPDEFMQQRGKAAAPVTPSTPAKSEQPGFFKRLGQSLGLPTMKEELQQPPSELSASDLAMKSLGPIIPAAKGAYDWGKRAVKNIGEGINEEAEAARNISAGQPIIPNIGKAAYGIVHGGVGSIPFIGEPMETAGKDVANKNYAGAAGGLTGVVGQVAAPELARTPAAVRSGIGNVLVDSMGRPKPLPRLILGNERAAALGEIAKPEIAERQGAQDIRAAKAEMDQDIASGQQARAAAREEMFKDLGIARERRGRQQAILDTKAETAKAEAEAAAKPKIVSPTPVPTEAQIRKTGSEGSPARWTNEQVKELAPWADPDAMEQARERGFGKMPLKFSPVELNPKSVTRFGPSGEVIEELQRPTGEAPAAQPIAAQGNTPVINIPLRRELPGTIPTISRTPRGRIPNIGEAPPQGAALPFPGPLPETSTPLAAAPPIEAAPEPVAAPKGRKIPTIGEGKPSSFKVPALKPIVPPDLEPVLRDSGWIYKGKGESGMHEFQEPGTNIKLELLDRDLNPSFVKRKIAEKERQYGMPQGKPKVPKEGTEETPL